MLSPLKLEKFKRLNEAVAPSLLTEDELTKLEDMVLSDKFGKLRKRGGFEKFNTNAIGGAIHSLYDIKADEGANYFLAGYGTTVKTSLAGTGAWSSAISGLSGIGKFQLQPYAGKFYLTDGVIAPKVLGGTALADTWSLEIAAPDVSSVQTGGNSNGNLVADKYYKWIFVYITKEGIVSPPSKPITHQLTGAEGYTTSATCKSIGFSPLPVSSDSRVTGRLIFRTLENGEIFYFHSQIDNVLTTWYDDVADADLGSEGFNYLNAPQTAKYECIHKERLWLANQTRKVKNWITPAITKGLNGIGSLQIKWNVPDGGYLSYSIAKGSQTLTASAGTSTLLAGNYTYRYVWRNKDGLMSDYIDTNTVTIPTDNTHYINLYGIPYVVADYKEITNGEIYRKKDSGNFELILKYKANADAAERLILTDAGTPLVSPLVTWSTNQTTDTELTGISYSDVGKPPAFILEDIRDVYPDDGDAIVQIFDDVNGVLVFKEHSICKIYTEGSSQNWRLVKLIPNVGAEANTIAKFGNEYCFIYQKKFYKYSPHSGQLDQSIGEFAKSSLAAVTTFHSATMSKTWYVLGVIGGAFTQNYGLFVFDFAAESWYKFNYYDVPYALAIKQHGASAGSILIASGQYVLYYGTGTTDENTVSSSQVDISPLIRTKTFGDGISELRVRKIKFEYLKQDNKSLVISVVNADSVATNTHTDPTNATNSTDYKLFEEDTGRENDDFKKGNKLYFQFAGAGLTEFDVFRLDFRPIREGKSV